MNLHEYMMFADGSLMPFPNGIPTAAQIADALIENKGTAFFWPSTHAAEHIKGPWYVLLPVFTETGGRTIQYEDVPDVIKLACMLE